jgi:hypothetical protein
MKRIVPIYDPRDTKEERRAKLAAYIRQGFDEIIARSATRFDELSKQRELERTRTSDLFNVNEAL